MLKLKNKGRIYECAAESRNSEAHQHNERADSESVIKILEEVALKLQAADQNKAIKYDDVR